MARFEFPASYAQRRMWLLDRFDPGGRAYHVCWAVWLDGPLDADALAGSWRAAVARHESLRTVFRDDAGTPVQVVDDDPAPADLPVVSFEHLSEDQRGGEARALMDACAREPFDLARGPLARARLLRLSADRHVLSLIAHHIVVDGWSFGLLFDEIAAGYRVLAAGGELTADDAPAGSEPEAGEPGVQYPDFTLWQLEHAEAGGYAADEEFWCAELAGAPAELALPVDLAAAEWGSSGELGSPGASPRPARETFDAADVTLDLDAAVTAALRRLATERGATPFVLIIAAYAALLSRLTGADDLLVGVPFAARLRAETEHVVGLFVNTVAIRADLRGDPTLGQLVDRLRVASARVQPHQELPFDRVVELCRAPRHPARSPLVQVMCAVEDSWPAREAGGLRWRPELLGNGTSKFELELTAVIEPDTWQVRLRRRVDLFSADSAERHVYGLKSIFHALARDPGMRVADVDLLPPATRELVTRVWPRGAQAVASVDGLGVGVALGVAGEPTGGVLAEPGGAAAPTAAELAAAACAGDRVVIRGSDAEFTGDGLRAYRDRVASGLRALGAGVGDAVGILLPRGARALPALLGVWQIGAAYLPLDDATPPARLAAMLADVGARVVIADRTALDGSLLSALNGYAQGGLALNGSELGGSGLDGSTLDASASDGSALGRPVAVLDLAELDRAPDLAPSAGRATAPDGAEGPAGVAPPQAAVAYTLFTSGSTGRPKAVAVTQGGLGALLRAFREAMPLGPGDVAVSVTTFAFDIALLDLLLPALCGACAVVADTDQTRDGALLRGLLEQAGATMLQATPTTWRMLAAAGGVPAGVRLRLSGGDVLARDLADALSDGPGVRLWNLYGPTETTVYSAGGLVQPGAGPVDIGAPVAGDRVYLLDRWMAPVAPGVVGELHIGGAGVGQGYVGARALTAQSYLPDPFSDEPGARLYRTGDLGRWRPDGRIELLGRADRQMKVRGFRVEAAEIEAALRAHPDVADAAAATAAGASAGDVRLVGYVVGRAGVADPTAGLRAHLRRLLPDYMTPGVFVALDELPRTPSGKVDYRALPAPSWDATGGAPTVAPRSPLERELADLVRDLLGLPGPVGVLDNFFVLGGHSLTATQLMARVWTNHGVDLPVRTLFDDPTVAGLAVAIEAVGIEAARPAVDSSHA